ncbi:hypothetical protein H7992_09510 [Sporosarcina sp. resist]|uniref:hypothetical protein n=1 Tax=Sporosarcina sp. resist TaxID=2762563 RepID=UPI00164CFCD1|nr:hypothetical protein [Sporosarcina sp. resist]QNK89855.1 hypothetical protein H7992_09510 [Sporosarcina sp. resist]
MNFISIMNIKLHKYLLSVGLMGLFTYVAYVLYKLMFELNDMGNAIQLSSFVIQSGMLFFMLLGYRFANKNTKVAFLLNTEKKSLFKLHLSSILLFLSIGVFFVFSVIGFTSVYYYKIYSTNHFYSESALFLINQWLLPFLIMGLIGYLVGLNSNSKFAYAVLILIWTLMSPTNQDFIFHLLANTKLLEGNSLLRNLNIGISEPSKLYHPFLGTELYWTKKGLFLFFLLGLNFLSILTCARQGLRKLNLSFFIMSLVVYSLIPVTSTTSLNSELLIEDFKSDIQYYSQERVSSDKSLFDYKIDNYDITIKNYEDFVVDLNMDISDVKQNQVAFTLYRGFKISEINILKGSTVKKATFTQDGDHTLVIIPQKLMGKSITLNVKYIGSSTFSNPLSNKHVYLPSDFAWIPSNRSDNTHFVFSNLYLNNSFHLKHKTPFRLTYEGVNKPDFINLDSIRDSYYEGVTSGVTLISGEIDHRISNGKYDVYFPISWFNYEREIDNYLNEFEKTLSAYNRILNTSYTMPETIILLPSLALNDTFMFTKTNSDKEHLIVQIDPNQLTQSRPLNTNIPYQIDAAFGNNTFYDKPEKFAQWILFNSLLGSNLSGQLDDHSSSIVFKKFQQTLASPYVSSKYKETFNTISQYNNNRLSEDFLLKWKQLLSDDIEDDWNQLEELIKSNDMGDM